MSEAPLEVDSYEIVRPLVRVILMRAGVVWHVVSPGASGCCFQAPLAVAGLECAPRAFRRYQSRRKWFSLGLSAHHLCIDADPAAD